MKIVHALSPQLGPRSCWTSVAIGQAANDAGSSSCNVRTHYESYELRFSVFCHISQLFCVVSISHFVMTQVSPPAGSDDAAVDDLNPSADSLGNGFTQEKDMVAATAGVARDGVLVDLEEPNGLTKSSRDDKADMRRMGRSQQLVRHFRLLSVASFVAIATAAWEIGLFEITPGLMDGGRPALVYSVLWNFAGFGPIYLSMAEMASMA